MLKTRIQQGIVHLHKCSERKINKLCDNNLVKFHDFWQTFIFPYKLTF